LPHRETLIFEVSLF